MNTHIKTLITNTWSTAVVLVVTILAVTACGGGGSSGGGVTSLCDVPREASLNSADRIGGATTSTRLFDESGAEWVLYNVANELRARPVDAADVPYSTLEVPGYIRDIEVVTYPEAGGTRYALLAMGDEGIAVVNLDDPADMLLVIASW